VEITALGHGRPCPPRTAAEWPELSYRWQHPPRCWPGRLWSTSRVFTQHPCLRVGSTSDLSRSKRRKKTSDADKKRWQSQGKSQENKSRASNAHYITRYMMCWKEQSINSLDLRWTFKMRSENWINQLGAWACWQLVKSIYLLVEILISNVNVEDLTVALKGEAGVSAGVSGATGIEPEWHTDSVQGFIVKVGGTPLGSVRQTRVGTK